MGLARSSSLSRVFIISEEGLNGVRSALAVEQLRADTAHRDTRMLPAPSARAAGSSVSPQAWKTSCFKLQPYMAASLACPWPRTVFCLDPALASSFPRLLVTSAPNPLSHSVLDLIRSPALSRGWSSIADGSFL